MDIANALKREPGNYLREIFDDIERKIIGLEIDNKYEDIIDYVKKNY